MVARSAGSRLDSAPSGMVRLAAVATTQPTGGVLSRSATAAASAVLPTPAWPVMTTPPLNRRLWRARSNSSSRATRSFRWWQPS